MKSMPSNLILLIVWTLSLTQISDSAVFTVDYGSENIKVAVVDPKPGMSPINIAINEMSKRKSPALVGISNGERLLSEEAAGISARYPDRVYPRVRDLLGRPTKDVVQFLRENYYPFQFAADEERSTIKIRSHDKNLTFHAEELVGLILDYARTLAASHAKGSVKDAVISIPPFFGQSQRQAILDAADIIGLNVMALIQEHAAVAIQYGIDKDFSNGSKTILFYDFGAGSAYAALVHFSAYSVQERGRNVSVNQFQVKGLRWEAEVGGQALELRLVEYLADEFNREQKPSEDVRESSKAMAKLKKAVKKAKEVLSANSEALISVEALFQDKDFRATVTRDKFEDLCEDLWERAVDPVRQVLKDTGVKAEDLDGVELVGGSTRIPKIQATLSSVLAGRPLDRHLDADEAVSLGSALLAANLSDGFKLNRKIGMVDGIPYGVDFRIHQEKDFESLSEEEQALFDSQVLFPRLKRTPSKSTRHLKHLKDDFALELMYHLEDEYVPVPLGSRQLSLYEIRGLTNATEKYSKYNLSSPLKVAVHFSLSRSGLVRLDKVEAIVDFWEWTKVEIPVIPSNQSAGNETEAVKGDKEGNATSANGNVTAGNGTDEGVPSGAADVAVQYEEKLRRRTLRVPLVVEDVSDGVAQKLSVHAVQQARNQLSLLEEREKSRRALEEAKNSLESHVYSTKDKLETDEVWQKVSTSAERSTLNAKLDEAEEWLYSEGEGASTGEFREKLRALRDLSHPIVFRAKELTARPAAVEEASKWFSSALSKIESWKSTKSWINSTDKSELISQIEAAKKWVQGKLKEQEKKKLTEVPAFDSSSIVKKVDELKLKFIKVEKTPKPKPKPIPKNATATNETVAEEKEKTEKPKEEIKNDEL